MSGVPAYSGPRQLGGLITDLLVLGERGRNEIQRYASDLKHRATEANESVKSSLAAVAQYQDTIMKTLFVMGCCLNFYYSSLLFAVGTTIGAIGSTALSPIKLSLQKHEVLGHTREFNYDAQVTMAGLAFLNLCLGDTLIDNMFFGLFGGLLAGNTLYYMFQDTTIVKKTLEGATALVSLVGLDKISGKTSAQTTTGEEVAAKAEEEVEELPYSGTRNLGELVGDFLEYSEAGEKRVYVYISNMATQASTNQNVKVCVDAIVNYQATIMNTLLALGIMLNCYYSSFLFPISFVASFIASTPLPPVSIPSLQNQVLGHTKEQGYDAQKYMGQLVLLSIYLGDTLIDNALCGVLGGALAGNTVYHMFSDTAALKRGTELMATGVHKAGLNRYFGTAPSEPKGD